MASPQLALAEWARRTPSPPLVLPQNRPWVSWVEAAQEGIPRELQPAASPSPQSRLPSLSGHQSVCSSSTSEPRHLASTAQRTPNDDIHDTFVQPPLKSSVDTYRFPQPRTAHFPQHLDLHVLPRPRAAMGTAVRAAAAQTSLVNPPGRRSLLPSRAAKSRAAKEDTAGPVAVLSENGFGWGRGRRR